MRHQKKRHKLGRTASHRKATLAALGNALITHKRVTTTVPRAKALRTFIEPIITRAKDDSQHNRRQVFRHLRDKQAVTTLFTEVAEKIGERPGGYTRVVRIGRRAGDAAPMAIIELVDYNETDAAVGGAGPQKSKRTRRGRRRGAGSAAAPAPATDEPPVAVSTMETSGNVDEEAAPAEPAEAIGTANETAPTEQPVPEDRAASDAGKVAADTSS